MSADYRYTVIGAGVVGLAIAAELASRGSLLVLEKEAKFGQATSSRNSEVVHAGIYYEPGSLKAKLCVDGRKIIEQLVQQYAIGYQRIGKYIVAVNGGERAYLEKLKANAEACGVMDLRWVSRDELAAQEPDVKGVAALFSPSTGIIDSHGLMKHFKDQAELAGADFAFNAEVTSISPQFVEGRSPIAHHLVGGHPPISPQLVGGTKGGYEITAGDTTFTSEIVINCAGLYADQIAEMAGMSVRDLGLELTWSRGMYYGLSSEIHLRAKHLIYPVPDHTHASLGVHLCQDLSGGIRFGPTAEFLTEKIENYCPPEGNLEGVAAAISHYLPEVQAKDLHPLMVGIRPKLSGPGQAVRDFYIQEESARGLPGFVNLIGIESPGLTAAAGIAKFTSYLLLSGPSLTFN